MTWHRLITSAALAALTVAGACKGSDSKAKKEPTPAPDPVASSPTDGATVAAATDEGGDETLKEHMQGHFVLISGIQRAVIAGDLAAAKEQAKKLAEHPMHEAVEGWEDHVQKVRDAANAVVDSADIASAATHTASLGRECGNCHTTMTAITTFEWVPAPGEEGADNVATKMKIHQWAADRLWEGFVGPNDALWNKGAEALAATAFRVGDLPADKQLDPRVKELAAKVKKIGESAKNASDQDARTAVYGELLTTCSTCHGIARNPQKSEE